MGHIHARSMMEYAKDATETDKPWERWEYYLDTDAWIDCTSHPSWSTDCVYHRKTNLTNGHVLPQAPR